MREHPRVQVERARELDRRANEAAKCIAEYTYQHDLSMVEAARVLGYCVDPPGSPNPPGTAKVFGGPEPNAVIHLIRPC